MSFYRSSSHRFNHYTMSKESFASLICSKITSAVGNNGSAFSKGTPQIVQQAVASAITEYLTANVKVMVSYTGTLKTGGSDPVVSDTFSITGNCSTMPPPSGFSEWVSSLQQSISTSFTVLSPGIEGVTAVFKPFNPSVGALTISQAALKSAHEGNAKNPMQEVWKVICGGIMDWINSGAGVNPAAKGVTASRSGTSEGTIVVTKIAIT